jgi:hypothetical protein
MSHEMKILAGVAGFIAALIIGFAVGWFSSQSVTESHVLADCKSMGEAIIGRVQVDCMTVFHRAHGAAN